MRERGPCRRVRAVFQFLIGSLEVHDSVMNLMQARQFQFLIGSLEVDMAPSVLYRFIEFQFLIGSLEV